MASPGRLYFFLGVGFASKLIESSDRKDSVSETVKSGETL